MTGEVVRQKQAVISSPRRELVGQTVVHRVSTPRTPHSERFFEVQVQSPKIGTNHVDGIQIEEIKHDDVNDESLTISERDSFQPGDNARVVKFEEDDAMYNEAKFEVPLVLSPGNPKHLSTPGELSGLTYTSVLTSEFHLSMIAVLTVVLLEDPREFKPMGYDQRLQFHDEIKMLVCVTVYNEPETEVILTLRGLCENLKGFSIKTKNPNFFKHVCVVLLADGREKLHESTAKALTVGGMYDESLLELDDERLGVHLFQSSPTFVEVPESSGDDAELYAPLQLIFLMKEKNAGKVSSHWWFFEAIAACLDPKYCVFFDVGTRPLRNCCFHIYRCFERNGQITGISGELFCREVGTWNPIIASQHLEYKIATILDRATESVTGFLSVLPGCLSAYRWNDLKGSPLRRYFEPLEHPEKHYTPFESLCNLGEDRILCLELFCIDRAPTLHYLKDAIGESDVCMDIVELLKQRRRWVNSTMAVLIMMMMSYFSRILPHKKHSIGRKILVGADMTYYFVQTLFTMVLSGIYVMFIDINVNLLLTEIFSLGFLAGWIFRAVLIAVVFSQIILGLLSVNPKKISWYYNFLTGFYGIVFLVVSAIVIYLTIEGSLQIASGFANLLFVGLIFNIGTYFAVGFLQGHFLTCIVSFPQYWFCLPIYSVIIPIYAVTNLHDLTWGTKSADKASPAELQRRKEFINLRNSVFLVWLAMNCGVIFGGEYSYYTLENMYSMGFFVILCYLTIIWILMRCFAAFLFVVVHQINKRVEAEQNILEIRRQISQLESIGRPREFFTCCPKAIRAVLSIWLQLRTYTAVLNILFLSPVCCIFAFLWTAVTVALALTFSVVPVLGTYIIANLANTWRMLAKLEYKYNSFESWIAELTLNSRTHSKKAGTGTTQTPSQVWISKDAAESTVRFMYRVLNDPYTRKSFLYIVYIKPLVCSAAFVVGSLSLIISLQFAVLSPLNISLLGLWNVAIMPKWSSILVGCVLLFLSLHLLIVLDKNSRLVTCWALGVQHLNISVRNRIVQDNE
jgi:cellulose synthase/poly-beta-1,6-N-acetylglucosamine synthase-like glycosyltransferase